MLGGLRVPFQAAILVAGLVAAGVTTVEAQANPSPLNCEIGGGGCTPIDTFGTLTFGEGLGDSVTITIDAALTDLKIQALYLNVDEGSVPANGGTFSLLSSGTSIDQFTLTAYNTQQADGCPSCLFDISFDVANDQVFEPATLTLFSDFGPTSISDVFVTNAAGLDAAVHFGNCNVAPCNEGSIWVGEAVNGAVPEPAALFVFGTGLVALAAWGRQKRQ